MFGMLRDCLCHPKYIVMHYKAKPFKIVVLLLVFLLAYVGVLALEEYNTDYFTNADNEEIITGIVLGEEVDIVFDTENNQMSGSSISYSTTNYIVSFISRAEGTTSDYLDIEKVELLFLVDKAEIYFSGIKVSEYQYDSTYLDTFELNGVRNGNVADSIAFKKLLTSTLDYANYTFSTISIVKNVADVLFYYVALVGVLLLFSYFSNPGIGKGVRFKLCILDSLIFFLILILGIFFDLPWVLYISMFVPIIYESITFKHIARKS